MSDYALSGHLLLPLCGIYPLYFPCPMFSSQIMSYIMIYATFGSHNSSLFPECNCGNVCTTTGKPKGPFHSLEGLVVKATVMNHAFFSSSSPFFYYKCVCVCLRMSAIHVALSDQISLIHCAVMVCLPFAPFAIMGLCLILMMN